MMVMLVVPLAVDVVPFGAVTLEAEVVTVYTEEVLLLTVETEVTGVVWVESVEVDVMGVVLFLMVEIEVTGVVEVKRVEVDVIGVVLLLTVVSVAVVGLVTAVVLSVHLVQIVEVDVMMIVEVLGLDKVNVELPEVTVWPAGHVVTEEVVTTVMLVVP